MSFDQFRGSLQAQIDYLKKIERHLHCIACNGDITSTPITEFLTAGIAGSTPADLKSITIVKTSSNTDDVTITFPDASTYILNELNESLVLNATSGNLLPVLSIAGPGTFKWHGTK